MCMSPWFTKIKSKIEIGNEEEYHDKKNEKTNNMVQKRPLRKGKLTLL